jgi:hypothetical protein
MVARTGGWVSTQQCPDAARTATPARSPRGRLLCQCVERRTGHRTWYCTDADGEVVIFCGVVIVVLALLDLALPGPWWWLGVGVFGAFALFLGLIDLFNVTEGIEAAEGGDVSISAGLYVVLLGAVAAFAGALIRERSVRPVTADGPAPT